jgi:hypothetical protein
MSRLFWENNFGKFITEYMRGKIKEENEYIGRKISKNDLLEVIDLDNKWVKSGGKFGKKMRF